MAPKNCGKCGKQVYPMDELKCLDKMWHKACFKCQVCGMTLNMKNYRGFEKQPYCTAHYPEMKHTQVAETPETKRIAENTKIQSQVRYHSDFEQSRGQYTVVVDDPEMMRHRKNTENSSLVKYHEEFEKNKGTKISVPDDPETMRARKNMQTISQAVYHGELERKMQMEDSRPGELGYDQQVSTPTLSSVPPAAQYVLPASAVARQPTASGAAASGAAAAYPRTPSAGSSVKVADKSSAKGRTCKAIYDYEASDVDEVSFREDDAIVACEPVDDGWLIGTVERSGRRGMLPANYVVKLNW